MGINSGSGSAHGGLGGAYQPDSCEAEESNSQSQLEDTSRNISPLSTIPAESLESKAQVSQTPQASMKKEKGLPLKLKFALAGAYLGLCALSGAAIESGYESRNGETGIVTRQLMPSVDNRVLGGLAGMLVGGLAAISYFSISEKKREENSDYSVSLTPASDDDSHPDENVSDYRGPMGH